jgi:membrane-bound lytic murein transglycosylase D
MFSLLLLASVVIFPREGLEPRVQFWKDVFTLYGDRHLIFHDVKSVHLVYKIVDLETAGTRGDDSIARRNIERTHREEIARSLHQIAAGGSPEWGKDAQQIALKIAASGVADDPRILASRIHVQRGIRERFAEGLIRYSTYRDMIEPILRREGVPDALAALPLVESSYLNLALSRTGAAGIWQFMPSTARLFMKVTATVDERLDPQIATRSAARLLRRNYDTLGNWPLAISAYNHGLSGLMRAKSACGNSIREIIHCYQGRSFGYASMNFYAEFLAAFDLLEKYRYELLPTQVLSIANSPATGSYRVRKGDTLGRLARQFRTTPEQIMVLNGMKDPHRLPAGKVITVPKG